MIWGTGIPCTEHCSTKSWPSMTVQSFRTLDSEGAASIVASSAKAKNRQAISDHSRPILAEGCSHPKSCRQTPHCPGLLGLLPWRPGFVSSVITLNFPLQRPGVWGSETGRGFSLAQNTGGLEVLGTGACPSPPGPRHLLSYLDCRYPGASPELLFLPSLALLYFLVSFIFFMSHW